MTKAVFRLSPVSYRLWPLVVALLAMSSVASAASQLDPSLVGRWVEAAGKPQGGVIMKIIDGETEPGADESKSEITAPVERADAASVTVLGMTFSIDAETTFENAERAVIPAFVPAAGSWVRLKIRRKSDGTRRVRTLRAIAPRDRFKLVGEISSIQADGLAVDIGGMALPVDRAANIELANASQDPLARFLNDDQKGVPLSIRVGDSLRLGGQVSLGGEWQDEFDLNRRRRRDRTEYDVGAKLDAMWTFDGRGDHVFAEVAFERSESLREAAPDTKNSKAEITRLFTAIRLAPRTQLIIGRQDFDEEREWLFDEVFDGLRLVHFQGKLELEAGAGQGRDFAAEDNNLEENRFAEAMARWHLTGDWQLAAYGLRRDDPAGNFEVSIYGLRSLQRPRYGLGHWLELSTARGHAGRRDIEGNAYDAGVSYVADLPLRPTLAVAFAHGDGESNASGRIGYRQSGLQDNNDKRGGVTSVRFYGELFDPELSNISIETLVFAVRPRSDFSISFLWHRYRKDVAAGSLADTGLRVDPNLVHRDLGHELDVVFGYRLRRSVSVELAWSRFWADRAYTATQNATLIELSSRFSF